MNTQTKKINWSRQRPPQVIFQPSQYINFLQILQAQLQGSRIRHLGNFGKIFGKKKILPPRVLIFLWRCLNGALPHKSKLGKFINECDTICSICEEKSETVDHLFFNCEVAKMVWFGSPLGLRLKNCKKSCREWIEDWLLSQIDIMMFFQGAIIMWCIWKVRNKLLYEHYPIMA